MVSINSFISLLFTGFIGICNCQGYYPSNNNFNSYNNPFGSNPYSNNQFSNNRFNANNNPYSSPNNPFSSPNNNPYSSYSNNNFNPYPFNNNYGLSECVLPLTIQGEWFSREGGQNIFTQINSNSITNRGHCIEFKQTNNDNFTIVIKQNNCYYCVRIFIRTLNVLEKSETPCLNLQNELPTINNVCKHLDPEKEVTTMFSTNPSGKNCRSSLEGVWRFAYRNSFKFSGECVHPEANISACQIPGTQFFNLNQQFIMNYRKCDGMAETEDAGVVFKCLGDWYIGKNHFFAVMNSRESRVEEKYRCFLANRDDDIYISMSATAECNTLRSPQEGPERLKLSPIKAEVVAPKCTLPHNFTGLWVNTANFDAEVTINATHMVEKWSPDTGRVKKEIYVCQERKDTRYVMARLGINGCQKDYVCFDFVPRHANIIRYRKGQAMIGESFSTVCAWTMFPDDQEWKYDMMIAKNPVAIKCPVAGKFKFEQKGDIPFQTRIRGGVTQVPRPNTYCKENISDFSVCDTDQKQIEIDAEYCLTVDYLGRPIDIYSEPDYKMNCIGYWKENLKSYLITYDPLDAYSRYRCWVYQRADLNKILMSMSIGAFCHIKQEVTSSSAENGSQVALVLTEYERENDNCPLFFEDDYRNSESATILKPLRPYTSTSSHLDCSFKLFILFFIFFNLLSCKNF